MARSFYQFSAFLYNVEDLRITAQQPSRQGNDLYYERWLEPITSFIGVKWLMSLKISGMTSCAPYNYRIGDPNLCYLRCTSSAY